MVVRPHAKIIVCSPEVPPTTPSPFMLFHLLPAEDLEAVSE
jgi:hypothetical protein